MAHRLVEKHPSTQDLILGKNWSHRIRQLQIKSMLQNHPIDTATQLEARILQLLSSFEWTSHSKLDHAYLVALRYFFIKGIIHSTFKDTDLAIQTLSTYAKQVLSPLLDQLK
jgi:hypothetical protein